MSHVVSYSGVDRHQLDAALASGTDHGGNQIEPFVDDAGGWPLRCCLTVSERGDEIAIIAWSPFEWHGPYREIGPIVVHTNGCPGRADHERLPAELDASPMVLRPYTRDHRIAYGHVRHVGAGEALTTHVEQLFALDEIDVVHGRNVTGGCFSFAARRR